MPFNEWSCTLRRAFFFMLAATIGTTVACAQISAPRFQLNQDDSGFSSSTTNLPDDPSDATTLKAAVLDGNALGGGGGGGGVGHKLFDASHLSFELGGGFNAPIGNDTPYITWGGNFTLGAGLHFTKRLSALIEYQFIDDKLPGAFIAAAGNGATNGNAHIWSITLAPVIDLFPKRTNSVYITGGGGFYHKTTFFDIQQCCDYYGNPITINTNGFSSRQAGANIGMGYSRRLGGMYGDGKMKLFAEARYLFVNTPPTSQVNGLGTTDLIPVTLGLRW